jgi:hypothetical protein
VTGNRQSKRFEGHDSLKAGGLRDETVVMNMMEMELLNIPRIAIHDIAIVQNLQP